jgi:26S proteasome regulatory subunit N1
MKRQLAFLLARAQVPIEWLITSEDGEIDQEQLPSDLLQCLSNTKLSASFKAFGKELGVLEPKSLEDVYKSHLENTRMLFSLFHNHKNLLNEVHICIYDAGASASANVDSARANLAGTFVNAFVNAGFGNDKLMVGAEEGNSWIYKNKDHGMHQIKFYHSDDD